MRSQAVAIALVVSCGIASYVSMRSMYRSLLQSQQDYYRQYRFADIFSELKRAPDSVGERIRRIPGVASVQTRVVVDANMNVPGFSDPAVGRFISIPAEREPMLNDIFLRSGRYIEPQATDEVIASEAFAKANHLALGNTIEAVINGRWKRLKIVGIALSPEYVYEIRGGGSLFPDNRHFGVLWISRDVLGPAFNMDGAFNSVALSLVRGANQEDVIRAVDRELAPYGSLGAYGREEQLSHRFISDEISQNRISSTVIPAIFLAVAALLVHLVLTRLVSTQRADIAIIRAFGYSALDIGGHYLQMGILIVLAGYSLGCLGGWYFGLRLAALYADFYRFPILNYRIEAATFLWTGAISVLTTLLGTSGAVRSVLALRPAEAMRPEAPARFRPMLIDRISSQVFSPATRMIVRNLERRPWKAAASVLAISCAVIIVVVEFGLFDALDQMMTVQFQRAQREDVAVTLVEARSSRTSFELRRLPGVMQSEPFRSVPVRLRYEHRSKRTAVLGLPPDGKLRVIVDAKGKAVPLPSQGLLLTSALADILGVLPGEELTMEVLDGKRTTHRVIVADTADEPLGTSAYMDVHSLNRLLEEGQNISGAFLQVDANETGPLYQQLKRLPAVAAVSLKSAAIASFEETIRRSMTLSIGVLTVFASVIAMGMIYSGARIALSERANELATLRILGFTHDEITIILLGEQALLVVIAVPLGFIAGYGVCGWLSARLQTELYRMPLIVDRASFAWAFVIVLVSALISGFLIRQRLRTLDIVAVLKARE